MQGRLNKLALGGGFVIVLALAIGLVQQTHGTPEAAPRISVRTAAAAAPIPGPAPIIEPPRAERPSAAREPRQAVTSRPRSTTPERRPELAAGPFSMKQDLKRDENGNLVPIIRLPELWAVLPLTEAPMKACIEQAGRGVTGKATLSFIVAAKGNKLVIETTGVQDEESLAGHDALLECMHRTANALVLDGQPIPELGTPIYVRRHVRLENGALAENSLFNFSYSH